MFSLGPSRASTAVLEDAAPESLKKNQDLNNSSASRRSPLYQNPYITRASQRTPPTLVMRTSLLSWNVSFPRFILSYTNSPSHPPLILRSGWGPLSNRFVRTGVPPARTSLYDRHAYRTTLHLAEFLLMIPQIGLCRTTANSRTRLSCDRSSPNARASPSNPASVAPRDKVGLHHERPFFDASCRGRCRLPVPGIGFFRPLISNAKPEHVEVK